MSWHTFCLKCVTHVKEHADLDWFVIDCEEPEEHDDARRIKCCGCGEPFNKEPE